MLRLVLKLFLRVFFELFGVGMFIDGKFMYDVSLGVPEMIIGGWFFIKVLDLI